MSSTFSGIELGKRALQTQQKSLDVVGHNIANAANEDYSRQRAIQSTTTPYTHPSMYNSTGAGQVGTGVYVKQISRMRDQFIDNRIRYESQGLGEWSIRKENLQQIESIYNELGDGGLKNTLEQFFQSFQDLGDPDDTESSNSVRETVIQSAVTLTTQMNHINASLMEFRDHLGSEIEGKIAEVNDLTSRIADLNKQIKAIESDTTKAANDLCDERDALIDDLSKIVDVQVRFDSKNQAQISLNGLSVVSGNNYKEITVEVNTVSRVSDDGNRVYNNAFDKYSFMINDNEVNINGGEISGLMTIREDIADQKMNKLDLLAETVIEEVNALHRQGFGKNDIDSTNPPYRDFFLGADASDIKVNDNGANGIIGHPENIAVAPNTEDTDGDGENDLIGDRSIALQIGNLFNDTSIGALGNATINDFWQTQASQLGIKISSAGAMEKNQNVLLDSLEEKKQEISGVSLDEEMTEMVKYQHGYNAASRVISVMDEMLDQLINGII